MKKICLLLVFCLFLSACSAFAEETTEATAMIEQALTALKAGDFETAVPLLQKAADAGMPRLAFTWVLAIVMDGVWIRTSGRQRIIIGWRLTRA